MSTPTSDRTLGFVAAALALGLTVAAVACSQGGDSGSPDPGPGGNASPTPTATGNTASLSCAVNGAFAFTDGCTAERVLVDGAPVLVIRHADGGFRRFDVLPGGTLAEADGALRAAVVRNGSTLEVTIDSDRYRLDASLLGNAP
jgi:hypothetical protein